MNQQVAREERRFLDDAVRLASRHQLYGRADAIAVMLESLERISRGSGEVLLIPGHSGPHSNITGRPGDIWNRQRLRRCSGGITMSWRLS